MSQAFVLVKALKAVGLVMKMTANAMLRMTFSNYGHMHRV
jgi:hypothetical protein